MPSRLAAVGTPEGVRLTWQLGTEAPSSVTLLRDGKEMEAILTTKQTIFIDARALPGKHSYALLLNMSSSVKRKLSAVCDTSVAEVKAYRSTEGVMIGWEARGRYDGFQILRDGEEILLPSRYERQRLDQGCVPGGMATQSRRPQTVLLQRRQPRE